MLHRFRSPELGVEGHDPEFLRRTLAYLRRQRYCLLSLEKLFLGLGDGGLAGRTAVFTIDDGYLDHAVVAAPVFAEFDCPVTTFVTTGFVDGRLWFWWDQIEYIFAQTAHPGLRLSLAGAELHYGWTDHHSRRRCHRDFAVRCTDVSEEERQRAIQALALQAEVELPFTPPPRFAPMSWDQARACEGRGMTFGPHTVTHPILARTPDAQSAEEISGSWQELQREVRHPIPIFCYPNGREVDFGAREVATLRRLGFIGAVTGVSNYASSRTFRASAEAPYNLPRLDYPDTLPRVVQYVSGFERFKRLLRGSS
jgi:peptidoglycan/xylan/chitin deacetylase (PgdA/CDA1 family)